MTGRRQFNSVSLLDLPEIVNELAGYIKEIPVWIFHGDLGSGKTTLIKALGERLGVTDAMSSPTFAIINEYSGTDYNKIYHFDFYRLKSEAEAYDIGIEEYFYSGYPCFIEWPERIPSFIPDTRGEVTITIENETQRTIAISVHVGKEENRV